MPACGITTNVRRLGLDVDAITKDMAALLSKLLHMPKELIVVQIQFKAHLCFNDNTKDPAAMIQLYNTVDPNVDEAQFNASVSKEVAIFLQQRLKIPQDRYLMGFLPITYNQIGTHGTVGSLLPKPAHN